MERRFVPLTEDNRITIEDRDGESPLGFLSGYASVYYSASDPGTECELMPGVRERIMPGAFDRAIRDDEVVCLFNHDPNYVLGRTSAGTLKLTLFSKGLRYSARLPDTQLGRDLAVSVSRGDIRGSSFAFRVRPGGDRWRQEGGTDIREITDVELVDTSCVTYPAYPATTVGLRAAGELTEVRASHERWRAEEQRLAKVKERLDGYRRVAERTGA